MNWLQSAIAMSMTLLPASLSAAETPKPLTHYPDNGAHYWRAEVEPKKAKIWIQNRGTAKTRAGFTAIWHCGDGSQVPVWIKSLQPGEQYIAEIRFQYTGYWGHMEVVKRY